MTDPSTEAELVGAMPPAGGADRRMVTLVREAKGWTQRELAAAAHLTQSTISKAESGLVELKGANLEAVATALDCPPALLTFPMPELDIDVTCLHHRRRKSSMTALVTKKVEGVAHLTRVSVESILPAGEPLELTATRLPRVEGLDIPDAVALAAQVRELAGLPPGPVANVIQTLESLGVLVLQRPLGSTAQDAVSSWPHDSNRPAILIVNTGLSGDRQRFTVAHELGHMVMHRLPDENQEHQADLFAASFLAPADDIRPHLDGLTTRDFKSLLELKLTWGMSVAALIRRALDVGTISDRQYREFQLKLNRLGWRTSEPVSIKHEEPRIMREILTNYAARGASVGDMARLAKMNEDAFRRYFPVGALSTSTSVSGR
jgi:Zn-dependent peptidase ImmA (M78 family)/DNA-binding XRE family transcriptional regulator